MGERIDRRAAAVGEPMAQRLAQRLGAAVHRRLAARRGAALAPQALGRAEQVGTCGGAIDRVGHVHPMAPVQAVVGQPGRREPRGHRCAGAGLVPGLARENGGGVVMAGEAQRAAGVADVGRGARAVVAHQLEFEASGGLVVADHFERGGLLVVGHVQAVAQVGVAGGRGRRRFAGHGRHHTGVAEGVGVSCGMALQRAAERNQYHGKSSGRLARVELKRDALQQRREREGQRRDAASAHLEEFVEQRAPLGWQVGAGCLDDAGGCRRR